MNPSLLVAFTVCESKLAKAVLGEYKAREGEEQKRNRGRYASGPGPPTTFEQYTAPLGIVCCL